MGSFLGISSQVWQTLLVLAFPVIYRSLPRIRAFWLRLRYGTPVDPNQPSVDRVSTSESLKRLGATRWILLASLYITVILRCTTFHPAKENPFAITRLPLNTPSVSLTAALAKHHRTHGLNDTPITQQRLLQRLTSLDSRLLFTILGPESLLHCRWCRPPSKEANHTNDHFNYHLPRLASQYALALIAIGLLTTNAASLESKRRLWRSRTALSLVFGLLLEITTIFVLLQMPSLAMNAKNQSRMIAEKMYLIRHLFFACVFGICSWAVMSESQESNTTALAKLGIQIGSVTHQLDTLVSRLRVAALQRSTVMRDPVYRNQTKEFWEYAENQAKIASKDKGVKSIKNKLGLSNTSNQFDSNREELKGFIETTYPIPTLSISDPVL